MQKRTWKIVLVAAVLALALALCGACSNDLLSFYKVCQDLSEQQYVEQTGTLTLGVESEDLSDVFVSAGLPADLVEDITIDYTSKADQENMQVELDSTVAIAGQKLPLKLYLDGNTLYFNGSEALALFAAVSGDTESEQVQLKAAQEILGGAGMLKIKLIDDSTWEESLAAAEEIDSSYVQEAMKLVEAVNKAFTDFDTDVVTAAGQTYTLKLDNAACAKLVVDLCAYVVNNADAIVDALGDYVDASVLFADDEKQDMKGMLDEFATACEGGVGSEDINVLQSELTSWLTAEDMPKFDFDYTLTKNSASTYNENYVCKFVVPEAFTGISDITLTLEDKCRITTPSSLTINIPATATDFDKVLADYRASHKPAQVYATIFLSDDEMFYGKYYDFPMLSDSGFITPGVRVIDNTTYLPLRSIGEACGEDVAWDSAKKQAYVLQGEEKIYVNGFTDAKVGRSYLKVRDFEKLGYTVDYQDGIVTLTK